MITTCTNCGNNFSCQAEKTDSCWCVQYPPILSIEPNSMGCLCPKCLKTKLAAATQKYVEEIKAGKRQNEASKFAGSPTHLQEGIDYYQENEMVVFTGWYHLKRGKCCGNNCRHCPYETPAK